MSASPEVASHFSDPRLLLTDNRANLGMVANFNRVLSQALGKYVKLICADDLPSPDCLRRHVEALENPTAPGACSCSWLRGCRPAATCS